MSTDLTVDGPGSPISLKKVLKDIEDKGNSLTSLTLLIDGTGAGIEKDEEPMLYITPEECRTQAVYYAKHHFNGVQIPMYLYRYLRYMFTNDENKILSEQEVLDMIQKGEINEEDDNYKYLSNLIKYVSTNAEAAQVIGLIQLTAGALSAASKKDVGIRLYFEHPETHLHPRRQARFVTTLMEIQTDYGFNPNDSSVQEQAEAQV